MNLKFDNFLIFSSTPLMAVKIGIFSTPGLLILSCQFILRTKIMAGQP